jgi:hypothetical protein
MAAALALAGCGGGDDAYVVPDAVCKVLTGEQNTQVTLTTSTVVAAITLGPYTPPVDSTVSVWASYDADTTATAFAQPPSTGIDISQTLAGGGTVVYPGSARGLPNTRATQALDNTHAVVAGQAVTIKMPLTGLSGQTSHWNTMRLQAEFIHR